MQPSITFGAEAGAVVVGWALALVNFYRRRGAEPLSAIPGSAAQAADVAKAKPAGGLGVPLIVALAAFTVIALLDGLNLGLRPTALDAGGAWCVALLLVRKVTAGGSVPAEGRGLGEREVPGLAGGETGGRKPRRKFPVIPIVAMNLAIPVVCGLYYVQGQPAARMIIVAAVAYAVMNSMALLTWRFRRGR